MAINKEDYLYISSLLRAREPRMLSREKAERMLDAPGFEDAAKMLTDSGYEDMSQMTVKQIEDALSKRRADVFHELETLVPDVSLLDLFRLKYDYHNIKVLVKSDAMHQNDASLLSASGRIIPETVQRKYAEDRLRDLPGELSTAAPTPSSPTFCSTRPTSVSSGSWRTAWTATTPAAMSRFLRTAPTCAPLSVSCVWEKTSVISRRPWFPAAASVRSVSSPASPARASLLSSRAPSSRKRLSLAQTRSPAVR